MSTVIAVDAMGSDRAPKPEVEGAILAARSYDVHVQLVGKEDAIRAEMRNHPTAGFLRNIEIVPAEEVIGMDEKAAQAVRTKKKSSIHVGLRLVRDGVAAGFVTAGNTGATMATAKMVLGALPGVDRPGLAAVFPTSKGSAAILLDVGANVDSKPQNLEQFAIMGEIYSRNIFDINRPKVGLLSIGEEEIKGNELTLEVHSRLKKTPLHYVGNVEGGDLFSGEVDVIVSDGFVGNIALKICEGLAVQIFGLLKKSLKDSLITQFAAMLSQGAFRGLKKKIDYTEYGGAPLLGVRGVCVIGHGRSNANAVKNAIRVAAGLAKANINEKIEQGLFAAGAGA